MGQAGATKGGSRGGQQVKETSLAAKAAIEPHAGSLRDRALAYIQRRASIGGATADEVADALRETVLAIRPRITELNRLGLIEDTGARRENISGRSAVVWTPGAAQAQVNA